MSSRVKQRLCRHAVKKPVSRARFAKLKKASGKRASSEWPKQKKSSMGHVQTVALVDAHNAATVSGFAVLVLLLLLISDISRNDRGRHPGLHRRGV